MPASSAGGGHPPGLVETSLGGNTLRGGEEVDEEILGVDDEELEVDAEKLRVGNVE